MPLTDVEIRNAVPAEKPFKLADEKGLHDVRKSLQDGIDPSLHRKIMKAMENERAKHSFEAVVRE
jgi:hypothetical protein